MRNGFTIASITKSSQTVLIVGLRQEISEPQKPDGRKASIDNVLQFIQWLLEVRKGWLLGANLSRRL